MGDGSLEFGVGSWEMGAKREKGKGKREKSLVGDDYYSFMSLNLLLRHPTYSSLYDLYVYKLNATDSEPKEMLDSMTNEMLIYFATD
jgi:hypothetical protein